jgi:hypothetical protein
MMAYFAFFTVAKSGEPGVERFLHPSLVHDPEIKEGSQEWFRLKEHLKVRTKVLRICIVFF